MNTLTQITIGIVSTSDRASSGVYVDEGLPALRDWLTRALQNPIQFIERLIPDEQVTIEHSLIELCDTHHCDLVFTTGGTGPAPRDVTPDATLKIADREMIGFGEQMRQISLHYVPTAILSRQTAVIRGKTLIVNLPGRPKSIAETLGGVRENSDEHGKILVHGIFASIPYCVELLSGGYILTNTDFAPIFRPPKK